MPPASVVTTTLRYLVDQASVKAAVDANSKVAASARVSAITVGDVFAQAATKGKTANDVLTAALGRTVVTAKDATDAYAALEKQVAAANTAAKLAAEGLDTLTASQKNALTASVSSSGTDTLGLPTLTQVRTTGLGRAGNLIRFAGQAGVPGAREASGALELGGAATALGADLTTVALSAGIAGVALGAVALAMNHFNDVIEEGKKALNDAIGAQNIYYKALGDSTTVQVQDQIESLKRSQPALKQQIAETQKAIDNAFAQEVATLGGGALGDAAARALDAAGKTPYEQLKKQLEDLNTEYKSNEGGLARLQQGLKGNAFSLNDLADQADEAAKSLDAAAKAEEQRRIAATESGIQFQQQLYQLQANGTADDLTKAIQQVTFESDAMSKSLGYLEKHAGDSDAAAQEFLNATDKIRQASEELQHFKLDAVDDVIANTKAALAAEIEDINAKEADAEKKALDDKNAKLADADKKASDASIKQAQDTADKRAKIERDYARSADEAIQDRDAVALDKARKKRDDDLKDLKDADAKQKAAIKKSLADQQAAIEAAYQKQLTAARQQASDETSIKRAAAQASINALYSSLNAEQRLRDQANDAHLAAEQFVHDRTIALANDITRYYAGLVAAPAATGIGNIAKGLTGLPSHALGLASVPYDGYVARLHHDERILTAQENRVYTLRQRNWGGITINGYGLNEQQVIGQVRTALRAYNRGLKAA